MPESEIVTMAFTAQFRSQAPAATPCRRQVGPHNFALPIRAHTHTRRTNAIGLHPRSERLRSRSWINHHSRSLRPFHFIRNKMGSTRPILIPCWARRGPTLKLSLASCSPVKDVTLQDGPSTVQRDITQIPTPNSPSHQRSHRSRSPGSKSHIEQVVTYS